MTVIFASANPHAKARPSLDEVLSNGTDRIMIACAFCTAAGVVIIRKHLARLRQEGSCLVVSAEKPTDIEAVNDLATTAPGRVWVHTTGKLPFEIKAGTALMHSKVFYAEAGEKCWLWVGSHNLTGRATEGANLEAAILLTGHPSEAPFVAARAHIDACRDEASPGPVRLPEPPDGEAVDMVIIHAETAKLPGKSAPWHVRLGLRSKDYDWLLRPVASVRLHLYRVGGLSSGWKAGAPWASYAGTLTGLNLTNVHPDNPGIPAVWSNEHYSITDGPGALMFSEGAPDAVGVVTQAVINISGPSSADEVFLSAKPKGESEDRSFAFPIGNVDRDMTRFFTKESIRDGDLIYEVLQRGHGLWKIPLGDLKTADRLQLDSTANELNLILTDLPLEDSNRARHPLIMRAKFRLRTRR